MTHASLLAPRHEAPAPGHRLTFPCRRCGAPIDATGKAALRAQFTRSVALDLACGSCGRRALYAMDAGPVRTVLNTP